MGYTSVSLYGPPELKESGISLTSSLSLSLVCLGFAGLASHEAIQNDTPVRSKYCLSDLNAVSVEETDKRGNSCEQKHQPVRDSWRTTSGLPHLSPFGGLSRLPQGTRALM